MKRAALLLYALLYALAALVAFRLDGIVPVPTVYVLLGSLYVIPIWLATTGRIDDHLAVVFLIVTPLLPALIVVDPLEVGFYGYDPYGTLQTAFAFHANGVVHIARSEFFAWPGFYAFLWSVTSLSGLPVETVGKYIPLVAIGTPLLLYLFARRIIQHQTAFIAAMGFAGVRTLYGFEMKFVDETTAFVLFFTLLFLLVLRSVTRVSAVSYAALLVASGGVLTHHYVGALVATLLVLWDLSERDTRHMNRLRDLGWPFSRLTVITGGLIIVMFLIVTPQFLGFLTSVADITTSPSSEVLDTPQSVDETPGLDSDQATPTSDQSTVTPGSDQSTATPRSDQSTTTPSTATTSVESVETPGGPGTSGGEGIVQTIQEIPIRFWKLLAANVVLLTLLSIVFTTFRTWAINSRPGLLVSGIFGSILAIGYGYSVAFGPIIPLDPSRYLIYMVGLLLIPAGYAFHEISLPVELDTVFPALVILLILTQLILIPPVVMYSNQAKTQVGESHYSPAQFAASDWVSDYDGRRIASWESGAWQANGIQRVEIESAREDCSSLDVWRSDAPYNPMQATDDVVYSSGSVRLYRCNNT